jgi:hypothetical protein
MFDRRSRAAVHRLSAAGISTRLPNDLFALIEPVFDAGYLSLDKMIGGMPGLDRETKRCVADAPALCAFAASMGGRSGMRSSKRDKDEVRAYVEHHAHEQAGTTG